MRFLTHIKLKINTLSSIYFRVGILMKSIGVMHRIKNCDALKLLITFVKDTIFKIVMNSVTTEISSEERASEQLYA